MRVLVVDDEVRLADGLRRGLEAEGFSVDVAHNGVDGLWLARENEYAVILLDVMLPGMSGYSVCRALRDEENWTPVIMLTAKDGVWDQVEGLDTGADDYLTKPFHLAELKARVLAVFRRKTLGAGSVLTYKEIEIDLNGRNVSINKTPVTFTKKEFDMLLYFIANKGKVVSKNAIAEHLWGDGIDISDNFDFIYSHIKNLRKKLIDAGSGDYIQSTYGMGYKFSDH